MGIYQQLTSIINIQQYADQLKLFSSKKLIKQSNQNIEHYYPLYPKTELSLNVTNISEGWPDPVTAGYVSRMAGLLIFANNSNKKKPNQVVEVLDKNNWVI